MNTRLAALLLPLLVVTMTRAQTRHRQGIGTLPTPPVFDPSPSGGGPPPYVPRPVEDTPPLPPTLPQVGTRIKLDRDAFLRLCKEKHSVGAFAQISSATDPQAAPGGGVYYLLEKKGVRQIYFQRYAQEAPAAMTSLPEGVAYYSLSPDGRWLLVATDVAGDGQFDLYLEEAKTRKLSAVLVDRGKRVGSVAWAPGSLWFAFTSDQRNRTDQDLYRYQMSTKRISLLVEMAGENSVTDISIDGKRIAVTRARSASNLDVLVWSLGTRELTSLSRHGGAARYEGGKFSGDGKGVFLISDFEKGVRQLYLFPLGSSSPPRLFTSGKWEVEDFSVDSTRTRLAYRINEGGYSRLDGFELDRAGRPRRLLSVPRNPEAALLQPSFASAYGQSSFFFVQTSPVDPSDIWLWQDPHQTAWTTSARDFARGECLSGAQSVRIPSFDKKEFSGFLYYPRDRQGPIPFLLYLRQTDWFRPEFDPVIQYSVERGFGVLAPHIGTFRHERVIDAARWLIAHQYAGVHQLALFGEKTQTALALSVLSGEPDLFSAAALVGKITGLSGLDKVKAPLFLFPLGSEGEPIVKELQRRAIPVETRALAGRQLGMEQAQSMIYFFANYLKTAEK